VASTARPSPHRCLPRCAPARGTSERCSARTSPGPRQILRRLLVGRLDCSAFNEGGRVGYRFAGRGSYAELAPETSRHMSVVTPAGFATVGAHRHVLGTFRVA